MTSWAKGRYQASFDFFETADCVNEGAQSFWKFLAEQLPADEQHKDEPIEWNFDGKFLVDHNGNVLKRFRNGESWDFINYQIRQALDAIKIDKSDL